LLRRSPKPAPGFSEQRLALVGGPRWYRISVRRCPVEVQWDGAKPLTPAPSHPENKHLLRDSELA
jgi:hypothetical protein